MYVYIQNIEYAHIYTKFYTNKMYLNKKKIFDN